MIQNIPATPDGSILFADSFERYLQDKGKGRGGSGGNYRRNAGRELERFAQWAAGDLGRNEWMGIVPGDIDRILPFEQDEQTCIDNVRVGVGKRAILHRQSLL